MYQYALDKYSREFEILYQIPDIGESVAPTILVGVGHLNIFNREINWQVWQGLFQGSISPQTISQKINHEARLQII